MVQTLDAVETVENTKGGVIVPGAIIQLNQIVIVGKLWEIFSFGPDGLFWENQLKGCRVDTSKKGKVHTSDQGLPLCVEFKPWHSVEIGWFVFVHRPVGTIHGIELEGSSLVLQKGHNGC